MRNITQRLYKLANQLRSTNPMYAKTLIQGAKQFDEDIDEKKVRNKLDTVYRDFRNKLIRIAIKESFADEQYIYPLNDTAIQLINVMIENNDAERSWLRELSEDEKKMLANNNLSANFVVCPLGWLRFVDNGFMLYGDEYKAAGTFVPLGNLQIIEIFS